MSYNEKTIKRLFAHSGNRCARCRTAPIVIGDTVVGDICHLRARSKKGPRYDPALSPDQRNAYENLILLCKPCHSLIDSNESLYPVSYLEVLKHDHEQRGVFELTIAEQESANLILKSLRRSKVVSNATRNGVAFSVGGDVNGDIRINQTLNRSPRNRPYPKDSVGANAEMAGYVDYLSGLSVDYWQKVPEMSAGRIGAKIKRRFRLNSRTRYHLPIARFDELVGFIIDQVLRPSPVGKRHMKEGTKLCRSFEEYRRGDL